MRKESDDSPSNSGPHVELDLEIGIWEEFGSKTGIRHHHCVLAFDKPVVFVSHGLEMPKIRIPNLGGQKWLR